MHKRFELFRLSLVPRRQMDFISDNIPKDVSREDYLRIVFSSKYDISHRGNSLHYVPYNNKSILSHFLAGRVGRPFKDLECTSPQEGFNESLHRGWKALTVILDPSEHKDGQKLAVEINSDVGKSFAVMSSVIDAINSRADAVYTINIFPISNVRTFWDFAKANSGNITRISFDFSVPNMFGGQDSIRDELKAFRDCEKAETVSIELKNTNGLHSDTPRIHEGVKYIEEGGGDIFAKTKDGKTYNSKKTVKITHISITDGDTEVISKCLSEAVSILGQQ